MDRRKVVLIVMPLCLLCVLGIIVEPQSALAESAFHFKPEAGLSVAYDDNVTYIKDNPISDVITTPEVGFTATLAGKRQDFYLDSHVAEQIFGRHHKFDNTAEDLTARYNARLTKYDTINFSDSFSHSVDPRSFENAFGRVNGRYFQYYNDFKGDYKHLLNSQLSVGANYENEFSIKTRTTLSDYYLNKLGTELDYAYDSATIWGLLYSYSNIKFHPGSNALVNDISLKLRRYLTPQTYADIQAGEDFIEDFKDRTSIHPQFRASLTTDIDRTTQTVFYVEKLYTTTPYTQELFNVWRASAALNKDLLRRLKGNLVIFYGSGKYITTDIKDHLLGITTGLTYNLTKDSQVSLSYSHYDDESSSDAISYRKNDVYLQYRIQL